MAQNKLKKHIILSYMDMILNIVIGFFLIPIMIGFIGPSEFGMMRIIMGVTAYAGVFQLGLTGTIARFTARYVEEGKKEKIGEMVWVNLVIYSLMAFIALVAGIIVYTQFGIFNIEPELMEKGRISFIIALIGAVLNIPSMILFALMHGHNRYTFFYGANIVKTALRFGVLLLLLNMGYGVVTVFIVDYTMDILLRLSFLFYVMKKLKIKLVYRFDREYVKKLFSFSGALFTVFIADTIFWKTDTILLGIMTDTESVTVYSVSHNLIHYFKMLCVTFSNVFLPALTTIYITSKNYMDKINQFFIKASRFQFVIVLLIVVNFIFLGKDFIELWLGKGYDQSYQYTIIMMLAMMIPMMQTTGFTILITLNKVKLRSIMYLISALLNIGVSIVLVQRIGVVGVAIGTAVALIFSDVIFDNLYYRYLLKMNLQMFFIKTTFTTICAMIPTVLLLIFFNRLLPDVTYINFLIKGIVCNVPFGILAYILTLEKKEKDQFQHFIAKMKGRAVA